MLWRGPVGGGAASGKVGSYVASHNKGGQYLRARTTPTNPNTSQQQAIRNAVTTLSTRYVETLTAAQRTGWQTYAANVSMTNALGDQINISGISMYIRSNSSRLQAGLSTIDAAPTTFDLGSVPSGTLTTAAAGSTGTLTIGAGGGSAGEGTLLLYISRAQNGSVLSFNGPYRLAGSSVSTAGFYIFTLPFAAGPTGSRLYFRFRISRVDGRLSGDFSGGLTV